MNVDRRTVLQVGGLMAAGGLVAACGSGGEAAASSPAAPADTPASAGSASAGSSTALAGTADVPVGGGVIVADPAIVITQPTAGEFKAFTAVCPHQGCLVGSVEANEIRCPCHGSVFSGTDGSVVTGPATQPLAAAAIEVDGDSIILSA